MEEFIKKIDSHAAEISRKYGAPNAAKFVSHIREVFLKGADHNLGRKVPLSEMTYASTQNNFTELFAQATFTGRELAKKGEDIYQVAAPLSNLESRYLGKHLTAPRTGLVSRQI